ncbi:O-methylsterigmatocystin oxidoreductase OS=Aspergillus parasiticus GN=ordA PE=3 SV=1 [Rhizoctonia solani AG-1 IB]|uniref:O-methylsterigmatocystin oxidoreductase n=1 Tax=Thanatephorus cucumeris (strain AG1-IB / isolate 7/3/14) TaxID=1108050 RepID=A0A0B7FGH7_THACB|nr:O-methylsterigmatocystin oxidoreductase OS=Aspergillus parasiticus GN=ordA PE=3 SV=1 [Rhizoctonia solani AG-1 IB]
MRALMGVADEPKAYKEWSKELGSDIISIRLPPGKLLVIVNSVEASNELLNKRSSIYSDRAQTPMITSERLLGWGNNTGMIRYGDRWRAQRRMTHELLHKKASKKLWPIVTRQARLSLQRLLNEPNNFSREVRRMVGSTLLSVVYGYEVTTSDDKLVEVVETAVAGFSQAAMISNYYVNVIPWLQYIPEWLPGTEWKRKANLWRSQTEDMLNVPFEWTRSQMATGNAPPSMLTNLLAKCTGDETPEEIDAIRWATGTLFAAGTDTSAATILVFIMAMAMHPEIQSKAQAEIDSVLQGTRLPEMNDRESMPYMVRIIKEVFRWKHTVPLGVPHVSTQDDSYKGYFIPSGTLVISNIWAMNNDERAYSSPEQFDPDRFLDPSVPEPPTFGFGRRSCPGLHLAEAAVFMFASTLLCSFNVRPVSNSNGKPVPLTGEMGPNLVVTQPLPYKCSITPRPKGHEKVLREWVDG